VLGLHHAHGQPVFPAFKATSQDTFIQQIQASGKRRVLVAPEVGAPTRALDAFGFQFPARSPVRSGTGESGSLLPLANNHLICSLYIAVESWDIMSLLGCIS
jgi:hypothetical protein